MESHLKAQRVSCKSQETSSNDLAQPFPSMAKMESKKSNSNKTEKQYAIEVKNRFINENSIEQSESTNHRLNEQKEVNLNKAKHKMMNVITKKVQHRIEKELAKSSAIASSTNAKPVNET